MIEKITIIILIICNIALWVSHYKMKMIIGALIKVYNEQIKGLINLIEGDLK